MRSHALCLTLALVVAGCRGEAERSDDPLGDTIAPIGTGTESLLTRERLELIDGWIRASIARDGGAPRSLDELRPPPAEAERYVPLERFLRDGWGRAIEYRYAPGTGSYELRSSGADGALNTADDITRSGSP